MDPNQTQQQLAQLTAALAFLMDKEQTKQEVREGHFKAPMPGKFNGSRDAIAVENWIGDVDQYFKFTKMPVDKEFDFAILLLEGNAKVWWRRYAMIKKDDAPASWEELQEAIRDYFVPAGAYVQARSRLYYLRQTGSVQSYIEEFQEIRMVVGNVSEPEALDKFVRGLRLPVEEHVRIHNPQTVDRAMELALNYEDARSGVRVPKQTWKQTTYRGPQPMDLDYAETQHHGNRRGDKSKRKKKVSKKPVECYACGEDHFVKECPLVKGVAESLKGKARSV
jgi:hypothetical protein